MDRMRHRGGAKDSSWSGGSGKTSSFNHSRVVSVPVEFLGLALDFPRLATCLSCSPTWAWRSARRGWSMSFLWVTSRIESVVPCPLAKRNSTVRYTFFCLHTLFSILQ